MRSRSVEVMRFIYPLKCLFISFAYSFLPTVYFRVPQTLKESLAVLFMGQVSSLLLEFGGDMSLDCLFQLGSELSDHRISVELFQDL